VSEINREQVNQPERRGAPGSNIKWIYTRLREGASWTRCFRSRDGGRRCPPGHVHHVSRGNKFEIHIKRLIMLWRIAKRCCIASVREKLLSWPEGPARLAAMFAVSNNSPRFAAFCRRYGGRLSQIIILQFAPCSFPFHAPSLFLSFPLWSHQSCRLLHASLETARPPLEARSINLSIKCYIENLFSPRLPRSPSALSASYADYGCVFGLTIMSRILSVR